ncbi:MAG: hypothetical protein GOVbin4318_12 [Prokaryotic dsDNA virus sp.]|nr:MAG: hypothetical protein GOVbin4318_12 [Prokaryotic dsDNA virus sp.]
MSLYIRVYNAIQIETDVFISQVTTDDLTNKLVSRVSFNKRLTSPLYRPSYLTLNRIKIVYIYVVVYNAC